MPAAATERKPHYVIAHIMKKLLIIIFFFFHGITFCQESKNYPEYYQPISLDDAFEYMEYIWSQDDKQVFKNLSESNAFQFRPQQQKNEKVGWIMSPSEKLLNYLNSIGLSSPDDYNYFILKAFHRKLNSKEIDLKQIAKPIKKHNEKLSKLKLKENKMSFKKYKVGDTLTFKYLRTFVDEEQEKIFGQGECKAKGILIEKRNLDFNLKIRLVKICDDKGIYTIDFSKPYNEHRDFELKNIGDVFWNFFNDWEPKIK